MHKFFSYVVFLGIGLSLVGCDSGTSKVETEHKYDTTVTKPATVTEKTTTEIHENK
jgi:hypothetical protein